MSEDESPKRSWKSSLGAWSIVALCVVFSFVTLKVFAARRAASKNVKVVATPEPVITVTTAKATYLSVPDKVVATGTISAVDPMAVGAEVSGLKVVEVAVEEGDFVRKGQVLARLNSSILSAQLEQARSRQRSALAQVDKARQPNRSQEILSLKAAVSQAEAAYTQEKANLRQAEVMYQNSLRTAERYNQVVEQGFVTVQEAGDRAMEAARQRLQASQFLLEQARQRLSLAQEGGRAEDIEIAQSSAQEIGGLIGQIEAQLEQCLIVAPDDGLILKRDVHLGEISSNSKPMFSLARRGELELRADVPQGDLIRLRSGVQARVRCAGLDARGKVWQLSPQVDASTRLGQARILLDAGSKIRSGMFAEATIEVGQHRALTVPSEAVLGEGGEYFVFRLNGTTAARRLVATGVRSDKWVEITQGLQLNDTVALSGSRFLSDGDKVEIKP
jgi:HlyD family secretion protein